MNDVINTKSKFFKLYADRRIRVGDAWDVEDVLEEPVDICKYGRNVALEIGRLFLGYFFMFLGGLLAAFMVATPIISGVLWLVTDNPWIVFFGQFGELMLMLDFIIVLIGVVVLATLITQTAWRYLKCGTRAAVHEVESIGSLEQGVKWVKAAHGKFCTPLKFDRESTNEDPERYGKPKW